MKRICLLLLSVSMIVVSCTSEFGKVLKSKDTEVKFRAAEKYYEQKKYAYAQQLYEELFPVIRGTDRFEGMYYKYAYCAYYQKDYMNAENLFKTFTETFPNSAKAEECDYMRAYSYYKQSPKVELDQTNTSKTIGLMQTFINTHPTSAHNKEATTIIEASRSKLELKEYKAAQLYFNLGFYKASAITFATLMEDFPDSEKNDEYKLQSIRGYYKYAEMSIFDKQTERYTKVITECNDFLDRFQQSKLLPEVTTIKQQSLTKINDIKNEQAKTASGR
jgi:outer membrane protein assembly factor BamD